MGSMGKRNWIAASLVLSQLFCQSIHKQCNITLPPCTISPFGFTNCNLTRIGKNKMQTLILDYQELWDGKNTSYVITISWNLKPKRLTNQFSKIQKHKQKDYSAKEMPWQWLLWSEKI